MYVPSIYYTLSNIFSYFAISYQRDKKKLKNVKNII